MNSLIPRQSFRVTFDDAIRADLRRRLRNTRLSDAVTGNWQYGMNKEFLSRLLHHWREVYDFDAAEDRLNSLPQFRTNIGEVGIHYIHLKGLGPRPTPLLLMNGWPSSFVEYQKLASRLTDPAASNGSVHDAFDVVIPAPPGVGFSDRPTRAGPPTTEEKFHALMTEHLGYPTYIASGTDIGAGVATRLALKFPSAVRGIHISAVVDPPMTIDATSMTSAERDYRVRVEQWKSEEGAYQHLQATRPQTVAFALSDSPAGLASWIVEKFYLWSDHGNDLVELFPFDMLIDNLMVYWVTNTIGSSMRYYYDNQHYRPSLLINDHVTVPTAICMWPKDLVLAPREWAERFYNVKQYTRPSFGGHFPGWEAPDVYAEDLRAFARQCR
ncbi:MAG: epoxide hydrolase [Gammaproteobacteria bacterium]|nr:epoxide hydrolase [Gammaproteobacteria bacterium]